MCIRDSLGVAVSGNFYIDTGGNFDFGATGTIGGCLPKLPYPCIETQCNTVCVPLPCVKGCATWLYGVCVVPIPGFCTSCATVCVPVPTLCYAEVGCLTCTVNFNITNSGLKDPIGASCTVPIVGTIGVSLSASCGKVCVNVSLFGATANLCTPCLW